MPIALWMALSLHPALRPCGVITGPNVSTSFAAVVQSVITIKDLFGDGRARASTKRQIEDTGV